MKIKHEFEYNADADEIADEFCAHDSDYQADVFDLIGLQFNIWSKDETKTATYVQILEIAEQLDDYGRWFIKTLAEYAEGSNHDKV